MGDIDICYSYIRKHKVHHKEHIGSERSAQGERERARGRWIVVTCFSR